MTPVSPLATRFAKAIGIPDRYAVPQSGPITSSPRRRASSLSAVSSMTGTLSLKIITLSPRRSASRASRAA